MRRIWRNVVITICLAAVVAAGCWLYHDISAKNAAQDNYGSLADRTGPDAKAGSAAGGSADGAPVTFEQWEAMEAAASSAPVQTASAEATAEAPAETQQPATQEQLDDMNARLMDQGEAETKYAEMLKYGETIDADTWDAIRHMLYYRYLAANGYPVPDEAEAVEQSLLMDFSELTNLNPDTVGWITSEGTAINYPVVHGTDNDYYLHHLFDGTQNATGTLFTDMYNTAGFVDRNTIIYGHHMRNGSMFASIVGYKEQAYYDEHPAMLLYTPGATYLVELFAGYIVQIDGGDYPCFQMAFENDQSFLKMTWEAKEKSTFQSNVEINPGDRIITLSTCTYEVYNARYVVHGKLTLVAGEEPQPAETDEEDGTAAE